MICEKKALLILPQVVNLNKDSDSERINVNELKKLLGVSQSTAYNLRADLLAELHKNNDEKLRQLRGF